ncbi:acyl carrier protein [uncultured Tateyamaria sp.]|uniref:acyl carrier protein n=1 Tax=uncultured Tateyamaria sp. TaxID=455651 RepID=UPI00260A3DA4|nr:acyl carrier protein [uncultured Tateyamaria sp.]
MQNALEKTNFLKTLAKYARVESVQSEDVLFGSGLNMTSIAFVEFILELEENDDVDIDTDQLDHTVRTAGQLYTRIIELLD